MNRGRRRSRPTAALLCTCALALAFGLAACGGDDDDDVAADATTSSSPATASPSTTGDPAPSPVPPCELVTKDEADALIGSTLQTGIAVSEPGSDESSCTYPGDPNGPTAQVEVFVGPGAKKYYDIDVQLEHEFTEVDDLGDEAYAEDNNIFFRTGSTWVVIRATSLDDPAVFAPRLETAARAALAKL